MMNQTLCNFVVALHCEAREIIHYYQLARIQEIASYPVYTNKDTSIYCIVSGIGMHASQSAVDFLAGWQLASIKYQIRQNDKSQFVQTFFNYFKESTLWINVGVAGHAREPLNKVFRVNKVLTQPISSSPNSLVDSRDIFYPVNTVKTCALSSRPLLTCHQAMLDYHQLNDDSDLQDCLVDMEGVGFVRAARRYGNMELIQLVKVVSDNAENPVTESLIKNHSLSGSKKYHEEKIQMLIHNSLSVINDYYLQLKQCMETAMNFEGAMINGVIHREQQYFCTTYKFSRTQSFMLHDLIQTLYARFQTLKHSDLDDEFSQYLRSLVSSIDNKQQASKQIIQCFKNELKSMEWVL